MIIVCFVARYVITASDSEAFLSYLDPLLRSATSRRRYATFNYSPREIFAKISTVRLFNAVQPAAETIVGMKAHGGD